MRILSAHIQFIYKSYKKTDVFISEDVPKKGQLSKMMMMMRRRRRKMVNVDDDDDGGGISLNSLLKVANQPLPNLHHLVKLADL